MWRGEAGQSGDAAGCGAVRRNRSGMRRDWVPGGGTGWGAAGPGKARVWVENGLVAELLMVEWG
ncbi:hypothetical protein GCM10009828_078340 [Actinoplanes couchii]|uniref:Uncharacterized protein n=1 Tax=Actinoplanes couchii TaxID=403638 RepID=A0ABQ3XFF3_9ACTN|nr:hypothetical protein Aco03nite_056160 [Actinoplanes couchii]